MKTYYVGMDVHQASTSIAVLSGQGKLIIESRGAGWMPLAGGSSIERYALR